MTEEKTGLNAPGKYDTVSKTLIQEYPEDLVAFGIGTSDVEVLEVVETTQASIQTRYADSFIRAKIGGEEAIVHIEVQTRDDRGLEMPYRMLEYMVHAAKRFKLPIYSHVIYLAPGAGRRDPGEYFQNSPGYRFGGEYKIIRLSELEGEVFLESGAKGLLPFTPLMRPPAGTDDESWLQRCVKVAERASEGMTDRPAYIGGLAVFGGLVYSKDLIVKVLDFLTEVDMRESTFVQHFLEQGIEQGVQKGRKEGREEGARETVIEGILETLEIRFEDSRLSKVAARLASLQDIDRLKELRRESLQTPSLAAFQETIASSNGTDSS